MGERDGGDQLGETSGPDRLAGSSPAWRLQTMMLSAHQEFLEAVRRDKPDITYTSVMSRFLRHLGVTLKKRQDLACCFR